MTGAVGYTQASINRNIMECKVEIRRFEMGLFGVLIETLWNVKYVTKGISYVQKFVLIETLWNVK